MKKIYFEPKLVVTLMEVEDILLVSGRDYDVTSKDIFNDK